MPHRGDSGPQRCGAKPAASAQRRIVDHIELTLQPDPPSKARVHGHRPQHYHTYGGGHAGGKVRNGAPPQQTAVTVQSGTSPAKAHPHAAGDRATKVNERCQLITLLVVAAALFLWAAVFFPLHHTHKLIS